eukprot:TRINITY_DN1277_c0_g1_i2.p1 TRINITY_DN1277_c0_g1~~TRINITY_DN1277_c0_g1_i2.p1  ORF type:complete len:777 (-),score=248.19 TRINITY_DN1277_c0_g1_i2:197-2527(-)
MSTPPATSSLLLLLLLCVLAVAHAECDSPYRSMTGHCNNLENPNWGVPFDVEDEDILEGIFPRFEPAEYEDIATRLSRRDAVANPIVASADVLEYPAVDSERQYSHANLFFVYMMQFVTHDVARTVSPTFNTVDFNNGLGVEQDAAGNTFLIGGATLDYLDDDGIPQQFNGASAFLDLSPTYGPTDEISNALREFTGGLLKVANRTQFNYSYNNTPNRDVCICTNTTTGERWDFFNEDLSNNVELFVQSAPGFIPEAFPHLGQCVSPAASFGVTEVPGLPFPVPNVPGVYTCPINGPPQRRTDIFCAIDYEALNHPSRSAFTWQVPSGQDWMPFVSQTNPPVPFDSLTAATTDPTRAFAAGDDRATENLGITVIQTMFLREHNRNARRFAIEDPSLNDEELFQKARAYTIAVYQNIVYEEALPFLIGEKAFKKAKLHKKYDDDDYDSDVDPRTGNSYAASAMRFGHSMVTSDVFPLDPATFEKIPTTQVQLLPNYFGKNTPSPDNKNFLHLPAAGQSTAFATVDDMMAFLGGQIPSGGTPDAAIMAGMLHSKAQAVDRFVEISINKLDVSNCFSGNISVSVPGFSVFRGRTHGLPSYHQLRVDWTRNSIYGRKRCPWPGPNTEYDPIECFRYVTRDRDEAYAQELRSTFKRLDLIDPFIGMIIESEDRCSDCEYGVEANQNDGCNYKKNYLRDRSRKKYKGGLVGSTASAIIADQFVRSKFGDRFWWENSVNGFTKNEKKEISRYSMADLICEHFPDVGAQVAAKDNIFAGVEKYN